jgi:hypothetical protein
MSIERPSLGFGDELDNFDPTAWAPKTKPTLDKPSAAENKLAAEAAGFRSRESGAPDEPATKGRSQRRRRTGRNVQFNIKTRAETIEKFCRIADEREMGLGEAFEFATELLAQHHQAEKQK